MYYIAVYSTENTECMVVVRSIVENVKPAMIAKLVWQTNVYFRIYMHASPHNHIPSSVNNNVCVYIIFKYTHVYIHICIHVHIHVDTHLCIYIYIQIHIFISPQQRWSPFLLRGPLIAQVDRLRSRLATKPLLGSSLMGRGNQPIWAVASRGSEKS